MTIERASPNPSETLEEQDTGSDGHRGLSAAGEGGKGEIEKGGLLRS